MRIVQYNDTYEKVGGTETYCSDVLFNLNKLGQNVFLLANGLAKARSDKHIILPASQGVLDRLRSKYFFDKKKYTRFKNTLAELQPDVVHLHHNRYHTYEIFQALRELKIPVVQTIHDYTILCPSQYYPQAYFANSRPCSMGECEVICSKNKCVPMQRRFFYPLLHDKKRTQIRSTINTFIAPTQKIQSYLEKAGFKNVIELPFYIDPSQWQFDASRTVKNTLVFVGRVEINKGIYDLLEAVIALRKSIPDIRLNIIGTGGQEAAIRKRIQAEQLDYIHLLGIVPHEEIERQFQQANVCVVPTLDMEQFGLVGIEAMASGTAVIGSNRGGIPEWCIHEQTGLVFEPTEKGALIHQIKRMLLKDAFRHQLVESGMALVKTKYALEQHFEQLLSIYQKAKPLT